MKPLMDAKITISRCSNDKIHIRIKDTASTIEFVEIEVEFDNFTKALTGQAYMPVKMDVRGLEFVGKKNITEKRKIKYIGKPYKKTEELRTWLEENAQEDGWILDTYLGSQNSVVYDQDGNMFLNYRVEKYIEEAK